MLSDQWFQRKRSKKWQKNRTKLPVISWVAPRFYKHAIMYHYLKCYGGGMHLARSKCIFQKVEKKNVYNYTF